MPLRLLKFFFLRWIEKPSTIFRALRVVATAFLLLLGMFAAFGTHPMAVRFQRASYDWLYKLSFFSNPDISRDPIAIVYVDELSQDYLQQPRNIPWDRTLYAKLIDRLREDGAAAVVLDVIFSGPSKPEADAALELALSKSRRVILGVDMSAATQSVGPRTKQDEVSFIYPEDRFSQAAASLGLVLLNADDDFIIRQHYHFSPQDNLSSLSWAAAELLKLPAARESVSRERWVKYYGGPETIPNVSFYQALDPSFKKGFFRDKVVFVGARPTTTLLVERRDEFRSSFSSWGEKFVFMPAVEVHATSFLNLYRQDWLVRFPPVVELILLSLGALFAGAFLPRFSPLRATLLFAAAAILVTVTATVGLRFNVWGPWLAFALLQLPFGLLLSFLFSSTDWLIQRRKLELEKQQAAQRIYDQAALLDKAQDAIVAFDLEGQATFWNKGAQRLYGWPEDEIRHRKIPELATDSSAMQTAMAQTLRHGEWTGEVKHRTKAGAEILVQSRWSLDRDAQDAPRGFLMINSDITAQRELETHLLRSQRMDSLGTLAGGIAHDLNNVLAPIMMGVELIRLKAPDPRVAHLLETIEKSASRGASLVKQVLTFARGVEGEAKIVHVRHLLKEMDRIFAETFPKNINITVELSADLSPVFADVTQLHQVFLNLCVNARDAMPDGGKLRIRADSAQSLPSRLPASPEAREKLYTVVRVADSGTGIPPEIAEKIFEPFFTTKEIGKGTGLGLATVASIIRKHHGFLDFASKMGEGTEFSVYLPVTDQEEEHPADCATQSRVRGEGELVLIVDDEQLIRATTEEILSNVGYSVITASHAQAALEIVAEKRGTLGLVLMDRMMPGLDSLEAMRQMRLLHPTLPLICMSGLAPTSREELAQVADEFLPKPFTADGLLQMIKVRINSRSLPQG